MFRIFILIAGMDLDCTPPNDSLCADLEDNPNYIIYNYYPCKYISYGEN